MSREKMTIDEAIAIIRKEYLCVDRDCDIERNCGKCDLMMPSKEPILEAYKIAIKALEQEPCEDAIDRKLVYAFIAGLISDDVEREKGLEYIRNMPPVNPQPCEDAISRQAVIDSLHSKFADGFGSDRWWNSMSVLYAINKVPPVNPTKTGRWEQYGNSWEDKFKCSECGKEQPKILCGERISGHWSDYCPNCGCRMIEPQERSDKA